MPYDVLSRYSQVQFLLMQSTACNSLHSAEERCSRWLLMTHDRVVGDEVRLTHEFLGYMLRVRRPSVSLILGQFDKAGIIHNGTKRITVINRKRLEEVSCEFTCKPSMIKNKSAQGRPSGRALVQGGAMSTLDREPLASSATSCRNKLLASLSFEDYQRIAPTFRRVPMKLKQVVHKQDAPIEDVYFPAGGAFSLVRTLQDGQAAEVATIGAEGAVGTSVFFGQRMATCDVLVQIPAPEALAMSVDAFMGEMGKRGAFYNRVIRYNQALMNQIMQTTVCNGLHSAEQRCSRWLLMTADRAGANEFPLTHEFLAMMLGVRRPTVTLVVATLQRAGLIDHRRGSVRIVDRSGLEAASCECYATVTRQMSRLLPEVGMSLS